MPNKNEGGGRILLGDNTDDVAITAVDDQFPVCWSLGFRLDSTVYMSTSNHMYTAIRLAQKPSCVRNLTDLNCIKSRGKSAYKFVYITNIFIVQQFPRVFLGQLPELALALLVVSMKKKEEADTRRRLYIHRSVNR